MRKVCEVYLVSSSATDERGVELTFPVSQYEMMDAFEQIHTKSPGDVYWQVDEFHCFDYLAPHLDESMSIFEFNSLTEQLSKLDERQETALEGLLQMQVNKHMQENGGIKVRRIAVDQAVRPVTFSNDIQTVFIFDDDILQPLGCIVEKIKKVRQVVRPDSKRAGRAAEAAAADLVICHRPLDIEQAEKQEMQMGGM